MKISVFHRWEIERGISRTLAFSMTIPETQIEAMEEMTLKLEDIYTPLKEAKEGIWRRWNDKELRAKVEEFLGGDVPEFLRDEPKAYLARQLVTPNFSFFRF